MLEREITLGGIRVEINRVLSLGSNCQIIRTVSRFVAERLPTESRTNERTGSVLAAINRSRRLGERHRAPCIMQDGRGAVCKQAGLDVRISGEVSDLRRSSSGDAGCEAVLRGLRPM